MIKLTIAVSSLCFAIGATSGYLISEATRTPSPVVAASTPSVEPTPTPKPPALPPRADLEVRYQVVLGRTVSRAEFAQLTDQQLNDLVAEMEAKRR